MEDSTKVNPPNADEPQEQTKVFRQVFRPVIFLMKLFGLCSDISQGRNQNSKKSTKTLFLKIYASFIVLIQIANLARACVGLKSTSGYDFYFLITAIIWYLRCTVQEIYLMKICWPSKNKPSMLTSLISNFDNEVEASILKSEQKSLQSYRRSTKITKGLIFGLIAMNCVFVYLGMFIAALKAEKFLKTLLKPFEMTLPIQIAYAVVQLHLTVGWLLPISLYCLMCLSMEFMLTLLQAKMQCFGSGFSLRIHMPQIRKMYVKTSDLAGAADDLLGPLALAVYFFDVVLFSFNLYLWFYKAKSFMEKFLAFFWVAAALANLMFISFAASGVAEKGKKVTDILQRLETDGADEKSHAELALLLFHLSGEPVVMTIWKLVPLYKSIIVSVFISLVTYFTLLLQFK